MIRSVLLVSAALAVAPLAARAQDSTSSTTPAPKPTHHRRMTDSSNGSVADTNNQTQSGVVNGKTGSSTLGPKVKHTTPTQDQAVTSKGDTLAAPKSKKWGKKTMRARSDSSMADSTSQTKPKSSPY
jgi:hypothetical protein